MTHNSKKKKILRQQDGTKYLTLYKERREWKEKKEKNTGCLQITKYKWFKFILSWYSRWHGNVSNTMMQKNVMGTRSMILIPITKWCFKSLDSLASLFKRQLNMRSSCTQFFNTGYIPLSRVSRLREFWKCCILQEIIRSPPRNMWFTSSRCWVKLEEWVFQCIIQFHNSSLISTAVAVVWSREDSDHIAIMTPVVSLHNKLMSPWD